MKKRKLMRYLNNPQWRGLLILSILAILLLIGMVTVNALSHHVDQHHQVKPGVVGTISSNSPAPAPTPTPTSTPTTNSTNSNTPVNSGAGTTSKNMPMPTYQPCTETAIPYKTIYVDDPNLYVGQTMTLGAGENGNIQKCPDGSVVNQPSTDVTVYNGTEPRPSSTPDKITYSEAQSSCIALGTSGTSAYAQCLHAYGY